MQKYCLTDCFKRKMNKGLDNALQILIAILVTIVTVVISGLVFGGIGWIAVFFGTELPKDGYVALGFILTILAGIIVVGVNYLFIFGKKIYNSTYNFAKKRYEGEPYKCSIFEKCKEEPEGE